MTDAEVGVLWKRNTCCSDDMCEATDDIHNLIRKLVAGRARYYMGYWAIHLDDAVHEALVDFGIDRASWPKEAV
jgi:hypothetical protein